jgi:hypothetical protein
MDTEQKEKARGVVHIYTSLIAEYREPSSAALRNDWLCFNPFNEN